MFNSQIFTSALLVAFACAHPGGHGGGGGHEWVRKILNSENDVH